MRGSEKYSMPRTERLYYFLSPVSAPPPSPSLCVCVRIVCVCISALFISDYIFHAFSFLSGKLCLY